VVPVRAPRVNDKRTDVETGERKRFASAIMPAWARKSPQVAEVLPLLYLHGLSSGDFAPALGQFLGSAAGRSAMSRSSCAVLIPASRWTTSRGVSAAPAVNIEWAAAFTIRAGSHARGGVCVIVAAGRLQSA